MRLVRPGNQRHHEAVAVRHGSLFHRRRLYEPFLDRVQELHAQVAVLHFASAEHHRDAHLVMRRDELADMLDLHLEVMRADMRLEAHFLEKARLLLLARFPLLLILLVLELRVVEDFADRRIRLRGYLDQIEAALTSYRQGFADGFDAYLRAVGVYDSDLVGRDPIVDASGVSVLVVEAAAELVYSSPVRKTDDNKGPIKGPEGLEYQFPSGFVKFVSCRVLTPGRASQLTLGGNGD